jgi:hypothetical protein
MKKYIACLAVLFFATQVTAQDKFSLGIKVGQNFSSVNQVAVDHNTASYHAGVNMHIGITDKIGIAPEVILSQTKLENTPSVLNLLTNSLSQPETYHLNYLSCRRNHCGKHEHSRICSCRNHRQLVVGRHA